MYQFLEANKIEKITLIYSNQLFNFISFKWTNGHFKSGGGDIDFTQKDDQKNKNLIKEIIKLKKNEYITGLLILIFSIIFTLEI